MKNLIKNEKGSVGYILIILFLTIFAIGFISGIFDSIAPFLFNINLFSGTNLDGYMTTDDIKIKDIIMIIWQNKLIIIGIAVGLYFYLWSQRRGNEGR